MDNLENDDQAPPPVEEAKPSLDFPTPAQADHFLQALVDLTNRSEFSIGITLQMDGFLVSGQLASGKAYFDGIASEMADSMGANTSAADAMRKYFSNFGNIYHQYNGDNDYIPPVYIHLRDAKFFHNSGSPVPGNRGVWWRGRITSVSGVMMGKLTAS